MNQQQAKSAIATLPVHVRGTNLLAAGAIAFLVALLASSILAVPIASAARPQPPAPSACRVTPVPAADFLTWLTALAATPASATPGAATPTFTLPPKLPAGLPASADTIQAVTLVWYTLYACTNAGDILRQAALFTPRGLQPWFGGADPAKLAPQLANPTPLPPDRRVFPPPLSEIRVLPDGRVGALINLGPAASPENAGNNYVIFIWNGQAWLIDQIVAMIG